MSNLPTAAPAAPANPAFTQLTAPAPWRAIDLIADLHLSPDTPGVFAAWRDYLARTRADALLILGDLFEAWIGDDAAQPGSFEADCIAALHAASSRISLYFMPGNRDFLVGAACLAAANMQPLADPTALHFGANVYLLTHGDLLCTDDVAYQRERAQARSPEWRRAMLARPLAERQALARQMRAQSRAHQAAQAHYADVNAALVLDWLDAARAATLIHGHTHQPGDHALNAVRWRRALSDWHVTATERRAQILRLHADGRVERLPVEAA
ncbi:MAG: UDP-2,3-diacylglucosamine diphosphatase [Burkholderiaceae bacterium]|jgi:UDP-2,3-diacylglucosamine hydrolase|nr:UDP-2,3-diacylglucosamine diphosphatase [Burkholderiaceae bacterium]